MKFYYRARTREGKIQSGVIEAFSKKGALDVLEKYGFYVTSLKKVGKASFFQHRLTLRKLSVKDIAIFTRQLSVMFKSSIPPVEALRTLVTQVDNSDFREKILKISEMVENGSSLSQAFSSYPKAFNAFYINSIKSGEASGKVSDSLNYLADHLEDEYNFQSKIKGAMIYPIVVIVVAVAVFLLMMLFVVPRLTSILKDLGQQDLPFSTKMIIALSDFIKNGGWILFLGIFGFLFFIPQYFKYSRKAKSSWDRISLKIPIIGNFYKKVYLTRFAENLSVLIAAGLPITQALKITRNIIDNTFYKKIIEKTEERVARGETISSVLYRYPEQIPPFFTQMVSTGEETGRLENTLRNIVDFYRGDIQRFVDNLPKILEPALILVLGVIVGTLVISIYIPLFRIGMGGTGGM